LIFVLYQLSFLLNCLLSVAGLWWKTLPPPGGRSYASLDSATEIDAVGSSMEGRRAKEGESLEDAKGFESLEDVKMYLAQVRERELLAIGRDIFSIFACMSLLFYFGARYATNPIF